MKIKKVLIALGCLAGVAALGVADVALSSYGGEDVRISIPAGSTSAEVQSIIREELPGSFGRKAALLWKLAGADPSRAHGSYLIESGMSAVRVAKNIHSGRQTPVKLTFNNMRTLDELARRVGQQLEVSADDFMAACDSLLPARGYKSRAEYPAAFIPDSHEFYWTASAPAVVTRLADARDRFWTEERRYKASKLGLRPVEVATVASIAEEETAAADERATVARLYINRLHKGMKLQADPTVKFATGDFSLRRITGKHLQTPSPYNTYLREGLPPGPIRIAEAATMQAVLDAPQHNYIYMCAKEDFSGRHNFASDYTTHMANARRYRAALDARGIK